MRAELAGESACPRIDAGGAGAFAYETNCFNESRLNPKSIYRIYNHKQLIGHQPQLTASKLNSVALMASQHSTTALERQNLQKRTQSQTRPSPTLKEEGMPCVK
jgi:hypothetical protein